MKAREGKRMKGSGQMDESRERGDPVGTRGLSVCRVITDSRLKGVVQVRGSVGRVQRNLVRHCLHGLHGGPSRDEVAVLKLDSM